MIHAHKKARLNGRAFSYTRLRLFSAAFVGTAFAGIDLDHVADFDEVSDRQFGTVLQFGRLHYLAGSVTASGTFGVVNLTHDGGRQFYGYQTLFEEHRFAAVGPAFFDERQNAFDVFSVQLVQDRKSVV